MGGVNGAPAEPPTLRLKLPYVAHEHQALGDVVRVAEVLELDVDDVAAFEVRERIHLAVVVDAGVRIVADDETVAGVVRARRNAGPAGRLRPARSRTQTTAGSFANRDGLSLSDAGAFSRATQ